MAAGDGGRSLVDSSGIEDSRRDRPRKPLREPRQILSPMLIGGTLFAAEVLSQVFGSGFAAGCASKRILLATVILYAVITHLPHLPHLRNALLAFEKQHIDA